MARRHLDELRHRLAAGRLGERAARGEAAAFGRARHVGHAALDRGQALAPFVEFGDRAQQAHGVGMLGPGEEGSDRPASMTSVGSSKGGGLAGYLAGAALLVAIVSLGLALRRVAEYPTPSRDRE